MPDVMPEASATLDLREHLQNLFGLDDFRPAQREVIEDVLAGKDVLCVMPTGAGKSLCYQLPAAIRRGADDRRLAADLADGGPGPAVARRGHPRRASSTAPSARPCAARRWREIERGVRRACSTSPPSDSSPPTSSRCWSTLQAQAPRGRRGPLRQPVGARLPARVPAARRGPRAARQPAVHRPDRDRHRGRPQRHHPRAGAAATRPSSSPASTGPNLSYQCRRHRQGRRRRTPNCSTLLRQEPGSTIVYCATRKAVDEVTALLSQDLTRPAGLRLPRRHGPGGPHRQPGAVHEHAAGGGGRDQRLRHGDQQARHPARRPLPDPRHARGLLPGGRPRRARRAAVAGA